MPAGLHGSDLTDDAHRAHVRAALIVSALSVAWTTVSGAGAATIGIRSHTAVLVAFGAVGTVDAVGSIALVYHFLHALRHERLSHFTELVAHNVVLVGLFSVGSASVIAGILRSTIAQTAPETSAPGLALAAMSLIALMALSREKQRIARRVPSHALLSDGHLSAVGAMQAGVTLAGTAIAASIGWEWVDGAATAVVGAVAMFVAVSTWRDRATD